MKADPKPETTELAIGGMTCASCVARVQRSLERVSGVGGARVNLATERAVVQHDATVGVDSLVSAVTAAGYQASPVGEPGAPESDEAAEERDRATRRRVAMLALGIALLVPSLILGMTPIDFTGKDSVMLALALAAWAVVGSPYHTSTLNQLRHGATNMDTLISLGSTVSLAYSIYGMVTSHPTFFETAVAIVALPSIGKYLETAGRGRTDIAIRHLLALRPTTALLVDASGSTHIAPVESLRVGDVVEVRAGDRIPIDGVVIEGSSAIDTSMVTGESIPRDVETGSTAVGGTINGDGLLRIRATAVGAGTVLGRIVKAVQDAQGSTAPVQRLADSVAAVFVPAILIISVLTYLGWQLTGHSWPVALMTAVAVVVVACPCALGLATPMAVMAGVGAAARRGILFKNAEAIEQVGRATTVVFDKTGTLTQARPTVVGVNGTSASTDEVLALAAGAERASTHPFARAIGIEARSRNVTVPEATDSHVFRGKGVRARVGADDVLVGTPDFLTQSGVRGTDGLNRGASGTAEILVSRNGLVVGEIAVADPPRDDAIHAVAQARELGLSVAIVSGDADGAVRAVADAVGVSEMRAHALPDEKAAYVRELEAAGQRVIFVGDGINDAPALASATVGMAMGGGAEIAIEAADAAILSDDPRAVATSIRLSRATMKTIRQNLFWAFAYNVLLVPLAVAGFVNPTYAAGAMAISSLFVVGNSLLLSGRA